MSNAVSFSIHQQLVAVGCHVSNGMHKTLSAVILSFSIIVGGGVQTSLAQDVMGRAELRGAGSTLAHPLLSKWARSYRDSVSGIGSMLGGAGLDETPVGQFLDYEPSGSQAGIMRAGSGAVAFGVTERPLPAAELQKLDMVQFPIAMGGIVIAVNIQGLPVDSVKITGQVLADIYLGKVTIWSDAALKALNPGLALPDRKIALIHRADGSGTTYNFTDYLSKVSPEWKETVGSDLKVKWPVGHGVEGNSMMALKVATTADSIGYLPYSHAREKQLNMARLRNHYGAYPEPTPASFQAAAAGVDWSRVNDFSVMMTDASGEDAYPMVAVVYVLTKKGAPARQKHLVKGFFKWCLEKGSKDATALGYLPLPKALTGQVQDYWSQHLK